MKTVTTADQGKMRLENIPISKLLPGLNTYNYRTLSSNDYDPVDPGLVELKNSIRDHGLINPITVVSSKAEKGKYDIVAGHRRYTACKSLGMDTIPSVIMDEKDSEKAFIVGLTENLQRKNLKPLEEALGFQRYMKLFNITSIKELCRKLG